MDDAALAKAFASSSAATQALARGYVAGWNRFLNDQRDQGHRLPAPCAAQPPRAGASLPAPVGLADASAALREEVVLDPPIGSNGWAFGAEVTRDGRGLLLGNPRAYLVDGQSEAMTPRTVRYEARAADGSLATREHTVWMTRWGPVLVMPRAGLNWTAAHAYAIQDANTLNMRYGDSWLAFNRAKNLADLRAGLAKLGIPWVNTVAADRHGDAMVADVSVVPDVDAALLERCAPSKPAAALWRAAGLPVLDGSRSDCGWRRDSASPVPGLTPIERMPIVQRRDWAQNSNDSFWLSNPATPLAGISPMVGPVGTPQRLRTRAGILEIGERLAARDGLAPDGKVGPAEVQAMLFLNRNHAAQIVLDDLLAGCTNGSAGPVSDASRDGCAALKGWDRRNNPESRGAGFALDAPLAQVQFKRMNAASGGGNVPVHGGDEFEGVLNKVETQGVPTLPRTGYDVNYGSSYLQTVTFDERGPVAQAILTYGQASQPDSPFAFDQLRRFAAKQWPTLPFHAEDVARQRVGEVKRLVRD